MPFPSAYYLLLLYLTMVCKPVIPLVQDVWAHAFYEQEHIATVHHQNGQNHVYYEVANAADENKDGDNKTTKAKSFDSDTLFHFAAVNKLVFNNKELLLVQVYYDRLNILPVVFTAINLPPPKV